MKEEIDPLKVKLNKTLNDVEFVNIINTLSDSIKEFCNANKNVNKNENILMNSAIKELNNAESILNNILSQGNNNSQLNSFKETIGKFKDILNNMQLNIASNEKNLIYFFEDAKIMFKKMKDERQKILINLHHKLLKLEFNTGVSADNIAEGDDFICRSELNKKDLINSPENNFKNAKSHMIPEKLNLENYNSNKQATNESFNQKQKSYLENNEIPEDKNISNNKNDINNIGNITKIDINTKNENEKLKKLNKEYQMKIKELNDELKKMQIQFIKTPSTEEIKDKDKIILNLSENIKENSGKFNELEKNLSESKNTIKKLQEENNKLKVNNSPMLKNKKLLNNKIDDNTNNKLNNLIKENNNLKNEIIYF